MHKIDRRRQHFNFAAPVPIQGDILAVEEIPGQYLDAIDEWQSYRHAFFLANLISGRGIDPQHLTDWLQSRLKFVADLCGAAQIDEFDNHFITTDSSEAAAIDNGTLGPGWRRHTLVAGMSL
ncbi:MAG: hypothetical protein ACYCY5_06650 [Sulfuricella sp.]